MDSFVSVRFPAIPMSGEGVGCATTASPNKIDGSDETLLSRLGTGDAEALGFLFERFAVVVRRIGRRILRDDSEAEDLVQDLFLFIQRKCGIFDSSKSSARSWIIQMAYHRALARRRYLTSRQFYSRAEIGNDANQVVGIPTGETDYSQEAVFGRNGLSKVLKSLTEDQREILRLHFFEGYTLAEIGKKVAQPLGNVRHHYYRGLDKLRKHMFANGVPVEKHHEK